MLNGNSVAAIQECQGPDVFTHSVIGPSRTDISAVILNGAQWPDDDRGSPTIDHHKTLTEPASALIGYPPRFCSNALSVRKSTSLVRDGATTALANDPTMGPENNVS
jgi:hypothetical protein